MGKSFTRTTHEFVDENGHKHITLAMTDFNENGLPMTTHGVIGQPGIQSVESATPTPHSLWDITAATALVDSCAYDYIEINEIDTNEQELKQSNSRYEF